MTDIARERQLLFSQGLDIVTREAAGARQSYTSERRVDEPARGLVLHITVTGVPAPNPGSEAAAWRVVESIGQQRFGIGFSYNAGAMQSGRLYEGQPLTRRGAHTVDNKGVFGVVNASLNYRFRAVALVQNVGDEVTDAQIDACARWAAAQKRSGLAARDAPWYGHRDFAYKDCPGGKGYAWLPELRARTEHYTIHGLGGASPAPIPEPPILEDDTMISIVKGDKTAEWWITDMVNGRRHCKTPAQAARLIWNTTVSGGKIGHNNNGPLVYPQADIDTIPVVGSVEPVEHRTELRVIAVQQEIDRLTKQVTELVAAGIL